jgi:outer membrane protein assembly factor BamB
MTNGGGNETVQRALHSNNPAIFALAVDWSLVKQSLPATIVCGAALFLTGCMTPRQVAFQLGYLANKPNADYDAVDRARVYVDAPTAHQNRTPYWTAYRGAKGTGIYAEQALNFDWPEGGLQPKWRFPVGAGFGSFVVAKGMAFTLQQDREDEALSAYDLETGRPVWTHRYPGRFSEAMSGEGPRATPVYHAGRVISIGALGTLCCVEAATGKLKWTRDLLSDAEAKNLHYGLAASPVVVGNTVIALVGEPTQAGTVRAYDLESGELRWTALAEKAGYSTPAPMNLAGVDQLVVCTAERVVGLNPDDGTLLWAQEFKVLFGLVASQPVQVAPDAFVISGAYGAGTTRIELSRDGGECKARVAWNSQRLNADFCTPVYYDGYLYGLDNGIFTCLDAATGTRQWKDGRFGFGQVLLAGDKMLISAEKGDLLLVATNPKQLEVLRRFPAIKGKTLNSPAIAHGFLLLRNSEEIVCYDLNR